LRLKWRLDRKHHLWKEHRLTCTFCQILAGELPGSFIYRDAVVAAFMDIQPVNPGHVLVVPVRHAAYLADVSPEEGAQMFALAQNISAALFRIDIRCEGTNLFLANGAPAGQEVFHAHLHVLPRYRGDGFGFRFGPDYGARPDREWLDALAQQLKSATRI
jgi:histidine triad (HIT) family protein